MSGKDRHGEGKFKRFGPYRIIEHQANVVVFAVLVITGLSQRYHAASWAQWLVMTLGGIDMVRFIHRSTGLVFSLFLIQHIAVAAYGLIFKKWGPSMIINKKDFSDAIDNLRYYFGITDRPARCDRYDYKQKFEYWGVTVGGVLMVITGLTLWFPTEIFSLLPMLPGQIIPAAKVAHTNEAMLAFLVIAIWHIYNSIFSPEVFPLDTSIFTGWISEERMIHEHPLEYERLTGEKLEGGHEAETKGLTDD
ncbi:MAG: cytochrome b/b6 domain-containing protein [Thermodesulfovibrionales bacterium]|nr:cytochrome b/b6 domain-containing protein [Thermodesulfovibrionales bacterium]